MVSETTYTYEYALKDHLGSVRVMFNTGTNDTANIIQETHYYPYGLTIDGLSYSSTNNNKLFSGKEYNSEINLNWYDFGARNYDPSLGMWFNVDPMVEKYSALTPYNYCANNPVNFIDPTGMVIEYFAPEDNDFNESHNANMGWGGIALLNPLYEGAMSGSYVYVMRAYEDYMKENPDYKGTVADYYDGKTNEDLEREESEGSNRTESTEDDASNDGGWDLNGDGKLQKNEADNRWLNGDGDVWVDNSKIDWSGLQIPKGQTSGIFSISTTDAFLKLPWETAATYGGTSFEVIGPSQVKVLDQLYHYQYRPNNSAENMARNFMTRCGLPGNGQGIDYTIHYNNPIFKIE